MLCMGINDQNVLSKLKEDDAVQFSINNDDYVPLLLPSRHRD
jgi:Cu/Ag efflux protein CusF